MPRPRKCRLVKDTPHIDYFKPRGVPLSRLTETYLPVEGYEALRLADVEGLSQEEAAARMEVSRHTFGRVLAAARRIVAEAVVKGWALRIEGGDYRVDQDGGPAGATGTYDRRPVPPEHLNPETNMAKIAVSSEGPSMDDQVDPRFGRAGGFVVVDSATMETSYLDNGASQTRSQGAGIAAAELVAGSGAGVVLTGYVGPKAFQALAAIGVKVGQNLENLTVRQAVERYLDGRVDLAEGPNRQAGGR